MFSLTACLAFLENEKDEEAFLRYYERYHRLVLYEAEKIVGPSAAEDVMQNTFVYIAKHFSTFRSGSSKKVLRILPHFVPGAERWTIFAGMQNRPAIPRVNLRMKIPTACSPTRRWTRNGW